MGELRTCERKDEQGMVPRPVEKVTDEVVQSRTRPLHVLEDQDRWMPLGHALKEQAPRREEALAIRDKAFLQANEVPHARLEPSPLFRIRDVFKKGGAQLVAAYARVLVLEDSSSHPDHLRKRPVSDALSVREASASVPPDRIRKPVDVL